MKRYAIAARLGAGIMLVVFWGLVDSPLSGVIFVLALVALSAVRYRFTTSVWLWLAEIILCLGYALVWRPALLGLWLPMIGWLESRWNAMEQEWFQKSYGDRAERLRLEAERAAERYDIRNAARDAEIAERSRIAQDIHDHVGHEISGALLALQTGIKLFDAGDGRTRDILTQTAERLKSASEHLRETVHNLKPASLPGPELLADICAQFTFCPAIFTAAGDFDGFRQWNLLAANLKESLTNAARHSNATEIIVRLDGNARFVRLSVRNDGVSPAKTSWGLGLTGMKERVHAAGGSFSISTENGFQVICVLPKEAL